MSLYKKVQIKTLAIKYGNEPEEVAISKYLEEKKLVMSQQKLGALDCGLIVNAQIGVHSRCV